MKTRKFLASIICIIFSVLCSSVVFANQDINVFVNNEYLQFDVQPVIENDRVLVPIRAISEYLNYDVHWDDTTETVEIKNDDTTLELFINKTDYKLNEETKTLDSPAQIKDDRTIVPLRLVAEAFGCDVKWNSEFQTVFILKYNTVRVSTAKELLENINDYTKIILTEKEYNLTDVESVDNKKILKEDVFDGIQYVINEVNGLVIESETDVDATVVVTPRYADVLPFRNCQNITVKNITAGHTIEQGSCQGDVIQFETSSNSSVEDCKLYGCGTYGITATYDSHDLYITNTEIYECSYGCVNFRNCYNVVFSSCTFRDCDGFSMFDFYDCSNFTFADSTIKNNTADIEFFSFIETTDCNDITFGECDFSNNSYINFLEGDGVYFNNCNLQDN